MVSRADMPMKERGEEILKRLEAEHLDINDDLVGFVNGVFRHIRAYHSRKAQLESLAAAYPQDISEVKARKDYTQGCCTRSCGHFSNPWTHCKIESYLKILLPNNFWGL